MSAIIYEYNILAARREAARKPVAEVSALLHQLDGTYLSQAGERAKAFYAVKEPGIYRTLGGNLELEVERGDGILEFENGSVIASQMDQCLAHMKRIDAPNPR